MSSGRTATFSLIAYSICGDIDNILFNIPANLSHTSVCSQVCFDIDIHSLQVTCHSRSCHHPRAGTACFRCTPRDSPRLQRATTAAHHGYDDTPSPFHPRRAPLARHHSAFTMADVEYTPKFAPFLGMVSLQLFAWSISQHKLTYCRRPALLSLYVCLRIRLTNTRPMAANTYSHR